MKSTHDTQSDAGKGGDDLKTPKDYPHIQTRPSPEIAQLFERVRTERGWSRSELAARCLEVALPLLKSKRSRK